MAAHGFSQRHACRLVEVDPKTVRRAPRADAPEIRQRLRELAGERRRFGYRRLGILLARAIALRCCRTGISCSRSTSRSVCSVWGAARASADRQGHRGHVPDHGLDRPSRCTLGAAGRCAISSTESRSVARPAQLSLIRRSGSDTCYPSSWGYCYPSSWGYPQ